MAVALAALPPQKAGVDVEAILATGAPARRIRIRGEVTMVSVQHDQDVIPSMDGTPARAPDQRVHVGRSLVRPKKSPLYYAHSSATYTETVRHLERKVRVNPWGRLASSVAALTDFLPQIDEETRVFFYEVWQELLEPTRTDTEDAFVALDRAEDFEPVDYHMDWSPTPLITLPEFSMSAFAPYSRLVSDYVKKVADTPRRILKSMRIPKTIRIGGHRAVPGFERSQEAFRKDIRS